MKEVKLHKYIEENQIEWHRVVENGQDDIIIMPYIWQLEEFCQLLTPSIFDDCGVECILKDGYLCFYMSDICGFYGICIDEVFKGDGWS